MKFIKEVIEKIKNLWNVYGGIALSTFIAWLTNWSKVEMDRWASYLILTLTCISLLTFFKVILFRKKTGVSDNIVLTQKNVKAIKTAIYPEETGEELGNVILYTIKGGKSIVAKLKKFFKEIWGNKFTLFNTITVLFFATLSQVMTYTEYLYRIEWFAENEIVVKILSPIIAVVCVIVDLYTTYTKYGFESLQELADRKKQKLSKEEKARYKEMLAKYKHALETAETKHKEYAEKIFDTEVLMNNAYAMSSTERTVYEEAKSKIKNLEETITSLKSQINEIEQKF